MRSCVLGKWVIAVVVVMMNVWNSLAPKSAVATPDTRKTLGRSIRCIKHNKIEIKPQGDSGSSRLEHFRLIIHNGQES